MRTKQSHSPTRKQFVATWTRSQVYHFAASTFDAACEKALADRHLYTPQTAEKLTVRQFIPLKGGN